MHDEATHAEAQLDDLTSRLDDWKAGGQAGLLFADFVSAQRAGASVSAAHRPFYAARADRRTNAGNQ